MNSRNNAYTEQIFKANHFENLYNFNYTINFDTFKNVFIIYNNILFLIVYAKNRTTNFIRNHKIVRYRS